MLLILALFNLLLISSCEENKDQKTPILYNADLIRSIENETYLTDTDSKIVTLDSLLVNSENLSKRDIYEIYNIKINYSFNHYHDYKLALLQLDTVETIANELKLNKGEFVGIFALRSNTLNRLKRYSEALMELENLRNFIINSGDTSKIYYYYQNVGYLFYSRKNYITAAFNLKKALETLPLAQESDTIAIVREQEFYNSIGLCFEKSNLADSALFYYKTGLKFIDETKNNHPKLSRFLQLAEAVYWGNIGSTLVQLNRLDSAENYFKKSIDVNSKPGNENRDAIITRLKLIDLMLSQNKVEQAKNQLDTVDEYLDTYHNNDLKQRHNDFEIEYYTLLNDTQKIIEKLQESDSLKKEVITQLKVQNDKMLQDVKTSFDQKLELRELKQKDKYLVNITAALIAFTLIVIFLLLKIRRNQQAVKRSNEALDSLNKTTQEQNENLKTSLAIMQSSLTENEKLLQILAHDIRNPVSASVGLIDLYLNENSLNADQLEIIHLLKKTNGDLLVLLDDVMYAKQDLSKIKKTTISLKSLVSYTVQLMQIKANEKSQLIQLDRIEDISAFASELNLWRVLCNLLANAIKFSESNTKIQVSVYAENENALFKIKDEGIGIKNTNTLATNSLNYIDRKQGTAGEESFGYGLRTSMKIVEAHNGKIWFESNDKGTTFYISIPLS